MSGNERSAADIWQERYAELLGCDNRPGAIAAAIEILNEQASRIPAEMARNRKEARDACIRSMRNTAVNCGMASTCSVAWWHKTSDELEEETK